MAVGTNSCINSNPFDTTATPKFVTPVMLPPGRLRLATSPTCDRIDPYLDDGQNCRGQPNGIYTPWGHWFGSMGRLTHIASVINVFRGYYWLYTYIVDLTACISLLTTCVVRNYGIPI